MTITVSVCRTNEMQAKTARIETGSTRTIKRLQENATDTLAPRVRHQQDVTAGQGAGQSQQYMVALATPEKGGTMEGKDTSNEKSAQESAK